MNKYDNYFRIIENASEYGKLNRRFGWYESAYVSCGAFGVIFFLATVVFSLWNVIWVFVFGAASAGFWLMSKDARNNCKAMRSNLEAAHIAWSQKYTANGIRRDQERHREKDKAVLHAVAQKAASLGAAVGQAAKSKGAGVPGSQPGSRAQRTH